MRLLAVALRHNTRCFREEHRRPRGRARLGLGDRRPNHPVLDLSVPDRLPPCQRGRAGRGKSPGDGLQGAGRGVFLSGETYCRRFPLCVSVLISYKIENQTKMLLSGQMVDLPCQRARRNHRSEGQSRAWREGPILPHPMPTSGLFPRWAAPLPRPGCPRSHVPAASPTHLTSWAWRRAGRGAVPPAPHSLSLPLYSSDMTPVTPPQAAVCCPAHPAGGRTCLSLASRPFPLLKTRC